MLVRESLIGQSLEDLTTLLNSHGQPSYRARQLYHGLYREGLPGPDAISTLPIGLRKHLDQEYGSGLPAVAQKFTSTDGTVRYLLRLADEKTVEAVFIPETDRDTLCISTQVGCPIDCKFCLTALMGLERNLTAGEIVSQVLVLSSHQDLDAHKKALNVVMMGMGEPLLNLPAVMKATELLTDPEGIGIPQRRITVSTSGITPKIVEFGQHKIRGKLAVSLNASNEEQRIKLMPVTRKYRLQELLDTCRRYPLRPWERLTFEYVLLKNVNDSNRDAHKLLHLLYGLKCKVNLIALNPGPGIDYGTPNPARVDGFQQIVRRGVPCFLRKPRGRDIYAACGQLKRTES